MEIQVRRYDGSLASDWAAVLGGARNGIFLFERQFMEYHSDRFVDISSVVYADGRPVGVLPASFDESAGKAFSHAGLTFGGPVFLRDLRSDVGLMVLDAQLDALRSWGARHLTVRLLPQIFCEYPSGEVEFGLWRRGFSLVRRDLSSVIPLDRPLPFNKSKAQGLRKAQKSGVVTSEVAMDDFHRLLTTVLEAQHGVAPVHSLTELALLRERFPAQIAALGATRKGELMAGCLLFKYRRVWHTQYLASSEAGRMTGALDLVVADVVAQATFAGASYVSFGVSTEQGGTVLNRGLLWQKESYGARSLAHDFMAGSL